MIKDGNLHELHLMAGGGEEREVRLILSRGVDVNLPDEDGWTPLHWACYRHEPDMAQLLIQKGADVGITSYSGDTALHAAATEGDLPCIKLVLAEAKRRELEGYLDRQNNVGLTALMWTASKGHTVAARLLLKEGASISAQNVEGDTVLHIAATNNQVEMAELLIERGADVDSSNNTGDTPLHGSAIEGNTKVTRVLLINGAGDEVVNASGQTPIELAKFWGMDTLVISKFVAARARRMAKGATTAL
mmetsp:Transcript_21983/g.49709  ORF Transcript_21983/g.49709 Transcript_21983/m.49709 type:complete len:247 (-) Transcript_21983:289-1029(-)|eukprot:CAMPEP_0172607890 /NCGR_PEP_ID=MMETSP1068-20121228/28027_1 /TAXON_ID=35684 /ORGANISM="Pseudopedinella elastica, Strain CCMP716" /LENGTH=246 /DNA_ID=CAMNT_0013411015 /DNA_START=194 /DNA_END=934 /DNA_ORIENTATION=+